MVHLLDYFLFFEGLHLVMKQLLVFKLRLLIGFDNRGLRSRLIKLKFNKF